MTNFENKTNAFNIANEIMIDDDFREMLYDKITAETSHQVRELLNKQGLNIFIRSEIKKIINEELKDFIFQIVKNVVANVNKKLSYELSITKKIAYSIDSEIKHTCRNLDVCYTEEQNIKNLVVKAISNIMDNVDLKKIDNKKLLENNGVF